MVLGNVLGLASVEENAAAAPMGLEGFKIDLKLLDVQILSDASRLSGRICRKEKIPQWPTELKLISLEALDLLLGANAAGFALTRLIAAAYPLETRHHPVGCTWYCRG